MRHLAGVGRCPAERRPPGTLLPPDAHPNPGPAMTSPVPSPADSPDPADLAVAFVDPARPGSTDDLSQGGSALLLERMVAIEGKLDRLALLLRPLESAGVLPGAAGMAADIVDEEIGKLQNRGIDPDARLRRMLSLLERLSDEETLRGLETALNLAREAPGLVAMAADVFDEETGRLRDNGIDPADALSRGARAALEFGAVVGRREVESIRTLLASQALAPEAIGVVSAAASALVKTRSEPAPRVGAVGLVRALRDPEIQRALGFLLEVGRRFGDSLREAPGPSERPPLRDPTRPLAVPAP
ncbi:MAG: DUF1641 domain-containing protein [Gemmatimonadales bacterium]|nr:MAG: DUF1641 domain-containing protein [Gemmatimonadales bacterium]